MSGLAEGGDTVSPALEWVVREVTKMPMDGNCLFHALVFVRDGGTDEHRALELRREVIGAMSTDPGRVIGGASLEEWVRRDSGVGMREYADKLLAGAWGGGLELAAYAAFMRRRVMVFTQGGREGWADMVASFGEREAQSGSEEEPLAVLYVGGPTTTSSK